MIPLRGIEKRKGRFISRLGLILATLATGANYFASEMQRYS